MNKFHPVSLAAKVINSMVVCVLCIATSSCANNDDGVDHSPPAHYRILTQVEGTVYHLKVGNARFEPEIQIAEGALDGTFDDEVAWRNSTTMPIRIISLNRWLSRYSLLAVLEDGSSLEPILADNSLSNSAVSWKLVASAEGGCHISNELLGPDLVLGVDTATEPFRVVMMSINSENESQRWTLDTFGAVDVSLVEQCL